MMLTTLRTYSIDRQCVGIFDLRRLWNAGIPFPRISFKDVVEKWDANVIQELLEESDYDNVAEYAQRRGYAKIILELLKKNPAETPEDLAKIAYPMLSLKIPQAESLIRFQSDYIKSSGLDRGAVNKRFSTALGALIEANEDYDLWEYLNESWYHIIDTVALMRGVKPYGKFSNEASRRERDRR